MSDDGIIFWLTLKLAVLTSLILVLIGLPLAYWLSESKSALKHIVDPLINLPLVLPPSVLGFYLLLAFSPVSFMGRFFENTLGIKLAFSFEGILMASVISGIPFMVQPIAGGFENLNPSLKEVSYTLGKSKLKTLLFVQIPNIKPSLIRGIVMAFCHSVGNFGVILMIGGSIPGITKVASVAIYNEVETGNYSQAGFYSAILIVFSFITLFILSLINKKQGRKKYD